MRNINHLSLFLLVLFVAACQNNTQQSMHNKSEKTALSTGNFGTEVSIEQAVAADGIPALFTSADSVDAAVSGKISASCKHSGCWMNLDMGIGNTVHVTFADESFTIPLDAAGKNAVAQGIAIRKLIPVATLQNYAREEGKSEEEVAAITEAVYAYEFIATGVLIEE